MKQFEGPAIIFAASQRTGSSMIVDDFQNVTGRPARPGPESEAFYRLVLAPGAEPADWEEALRRVQAFRAGEAIFFDKVMFHQIHRLAALIDPADRTPNADSFAKFFANAVWVHIRRADLFEQAVSKYLAEETKVWFPEDTDQTDYNRDVAFDPEQALNQLRHLLKEDNNWKRFFRFHGIKPIQIYYEDAVQNYPRYLAPLLGAARLDFDLTSAPPRRMQKLGDDRNKVLAEILRNVMARETLTTHFSMKEVFR